MSLLSILSNVLTNNSKRLSAPVPKGYYSHTYKYITDVVVSSDELQAFCELIAGLSDMDLTFVGEMYNDKSDSEPTMFFHFDYIDTSMNTIQFDCDIVDNGILVCIVAYSERNMRVLCEQVQTFFLNNISEYFSYANYDLFA